MTDIAKLWSQTYSGVKFHAWEPRAEMLSLLDIAMGLRETRFAQQTLGVQTYTVAQHSVLCSRIAAPEHKLAALMHDAHEFIFKDIPSPIKRHPCMAGYVAACDVLQNVINEWCGLPKDAHLHAEVHRVDLTLLATEKRDLMGPSPEEWFPMPDPMPKQIVAWSAEYAADEWMDRFYALVDPLVGERIRCHSP